MKRIAFIFSILAMTVVFGFVQRTPSAAMANCSKSVIANGFLNAGGNSAYALIASVNTYAGETLSLSLDNANPTQAVYLQIGNQTLTQVGEGTLSVYFNQAASNVVVKGGGAAIYTPNTYYMIGYELDAYSPCRRYQ